MTAVSSIRRRSVHVRLDNFTFFHVLGFLKRHSDIYTLFAFEALCQFSVFSRNSLFVVRGRVLPFFSFVLPLSRFRACGLSTLFWLGSSKPYSRTPSDLRFEALTARKRSRDGDRFLIGSDEQILFSPRFSVRQVLLRASRAVVIFFGVHFRRRPVTAHPMKMSGRADGWFFHGGSRCRSLLLFS